VPKSNTESNLAAGPYSFQATYSGDANYGGSTSPCEPFTVKAPPPISQITPTNTTCAQFSSGSAATQGPITYSTKGTTISQAAPGVIFYWVKVTASAGQTFTINQTTTYKPNGTTQVLFAKASGSFAYNANCGTLSNKITGTNGALSVTFATAGTYFIGIKYSPTSVVGTGPAAVKFTPPFNYQYTFSTSTGGTTLPGSTNTVALNHK
jgi:hypothetical protein